MQFSSRSKAFALLSLMNLWVFLAPAALSHSGHGSEFDFSDILLQKNTPPSSI
jgi:hypothetical protein